MAAIDVAGDGGFDQDGVGAEMPSHPCPQCSGRLRRVSVEQVRERHAAGEWKRRFAAHVSDLPPGRYRCSGCVSEWWQYPGALAS